ncbi:cholinesterase [Sarocladium strictum]
MSLFNVLQLTLALPYLVGASATQKSCGPVVRVTNGSLLGSHDAIWSQDYFLGVPYAQPPVGDLRFAVAQSLNETWQGPHAVDEYGSTCISYGGDNKDLPMSEDCLTLNVVRGAGAHRRTRLPVAVWIHGGGFGDGSSRDQRYNLSAIVKHSHSIGSPMIAVSINYRLNVFGFLHGDDMIGTGNTNIGLRDQRLALQWIQENIEAFGGDPTKVTIWGESAGGTSVGLHLVSYGGRDDKLFRGAIMQSGSPLRTYMDPRHSQGQFDEIVEKVGCKDSLSSLSCLRKVPLDRINKAVNGSGYGFFPTPDGDILRNRGSIHLDREEFVPVPILIGANTDEGTGFAPHPVQNDTVFKEFLTNGSFVFKVPPHIAENIVDLYSTANGQSLEPGPDPDSNNGDAWASVATFTGDLNFIAARRSMCERWASSGLTAFCYRFNADNSATNWNAGVTHFEEIPFVFLNLLGLGYESHGGDPFRNKGPEYTDLAYTIAGMWISFIAHQDPGTSGNSAGLMWPKYTDRSAASVFVFDANVTSHTETDSWRAGQIKYLNSLQTLFKK